MQLGMIGLGRMGANIVPRLGRAGPECVVYDVSGPAVRAGPRGRDRGRVAPRVRAGAGPSPDGVDHGAGGGGGPDAGVARAPARLMIGGEEAVVKRLDPIFAALAPGLGDIPRTPGREGNDGTAEHGYLHCGPNGAGHFVKMAHNGIEYGLMAANAEALNILHHANAGAATADAETAPLRTPEHYRYDLNLRDITEVWRRGSVVAFWLLDLPANALTRSRDLDGFSGRVSDSGEGRWTIAAALNEGVPAPVLRATLYERFSSRGNGEFAAKLLSALRFEFVGHQEQPAAGGPPRA